MLEFFRKNQFFYSLLLLPYAAVIRIYSLINPISFEKTEYSSEFFNLIYGPIESFPILQSILAIILVFIQAMIINQIVSKNRMSKVNTLFPGVFYILFVSASKAFLTFSPILVGNLFFLIAIYNIFNVYKNPKSAGNIFNFGFFTTVAGFFYFPFFLFMIIGVISIGILRSIKIVEILQCILGLVCGTLIVTTPYFYTDRMSDLWKHALISFDLSPFLQWMTFDWILLLAFLVYIIIQVLNYNSFIKKMSIQVHKKFDILYWTLLIGSLTFILVQPLSLSHYIIAAIPVAILTGLTIEQIKNRMLGELIHTVVLIGIFFFEFNTFF